MNLPARSHRHPATNSSPPLVNRRVVLKASAMLASLVSGTRTAIEPPQTAAAAGSTASYDWYEAAELGAIGGSADSGPIVVPTSFPFTAVGAHWDGAAGDWPVVEVHISYDGENWSEPFRLEASHDRGQPTRDDRIFTGLLCANGATHIAYAVFDAAGHRTTVPGFALTYIDSSGGPALQAMGAENGAMSSPPQIVSRSEWGADESYRFTESGEWWTLRYETVRHAILHHSETSNVDDPLEAMRSIYHYHAVTRGWHDIGYNFLVDRYGNIYQGRVGGQNVVAGHAFAYSTGSCGIAFLGNHTFADISEAALASMVAIVAWAVRFQDPWGSAEFHDIADLPTICGHRDVSNTLCPGDFAYDDLEIIRSLVAETLAVKHDGPAGHLVVGDYVETNDG
ncbi:MAG: N-acetylmuramoyl-L-alanine amidase, partial [Thermomicrobiales bacterium]